MANSSVETVWISKLVTLLEANIPVELCIQTLEHDMDLSSLQGWMSSLLRDLQRGQSLGVVLGANPLPIWSAGVCRALEEAQRPEDLIEVLRASLEEGSGVEQGEGGYFSVLCRDVVEQHATHIHLDPTARGGVVRLRVGGRLRVAKNLERGEFVELVEFFKRISALRPAPYGMPQSGRSLLQVGDPKRDLEFDVGTYQSLHGEGVVVHVKDQTRALEYVRDAKRLFPNESQREEIFKAATFPHGLFLITGPAGCGKTTTAYSLFLRLDPERNQLFSIEQDVGLPLPGVQQLLVHDPHTTPSDSPQHTTPLPALAPTLRHLVRLDPDAVLCCAFPTQDTAQHLIDLALTGHIVFVVCQEPTPSQALQTFLDFGIEGRELAQVLRGVLNQRLVRKVCQSCKKSDNIHPSVHYGHEVLESYSGVGCEECHHTGFRGRTPVYELCVPSEDQREALRSQGEVPKASDSKEGLFHGAFHAIHEGHVTLQSILDMCEDSVE